MGVYTNAAVAVRIAREKGMSYEDIAELCGVSVGSVKRWLATGRADQDAIAPLLARVGRYSVLLPSQIADHLLHLYELGPREKKGLAVRRYRLTQAQLAKIAGRDFVAAETKNDLRVELRNRGLVFVEGAKDIAIVSWKSLLAACAPIEDGEIASFNHSLAEQIEEFGEEKDDEEYEDDEKV